MQPLRIREISIAGLIAALYVVLSLAFLPFSFGVYQVRIAEALTVLPFFTRAAIPGLYVGCVLANIFGGMGWLDIVIGPLLTLVAAIATRYAAHLSSSQKTTLVASVPLIFMWLGSIYLLTEFRVDFKIMTGVILTILAFVAMVFAVRVSTESSEGRPLGLAMKLLSVLLVLVGWYMMRSAAELKFDLTGLGLMLAALLTYMYLMEVRLKGRNPNILIAPLPPVILNAFGVSAYLAPLLGFNYWFSVQMVGIGELISCYLIGLPLLILLQKRSLFR